MFIAKLIGTLAIIFSITSTLCTVYYGVRYWWEGYFQSPMAMMQMMPQKSMMNDGMSHKMDQKMDSGKQ